MTIPAAVPGRKPLILVIDRYTYVGVHAFRRVNSSVGLALPSWPRYNRSAELTRTVLLFLSQRVKTSRAIYSRDFIDAKWRQERGR